MFLSAVLSQQYLIDNFRRKVRVQNSANSYDSLRNFEKREKCNISSLEFLRISPLDYYGLSVKHYQFEKRKLQFRQQKSVGGYTAEYRDNCFVKYHFKLKF